MGRTISKRSTKRCGARHPMYGKQVQCEEPIGHTGEHFHSFYMRSWPQSVRHARYSMARITPRSDGLYG